MKSTREASILKFRNNNLSNSDDLLAIEEPLEIRLAFFKDSTQTEKNISVTMRTPANDEELAIGFLFTEGIITNFNQIQSVACKEENVVTVELIPTIEVDLSSLQRNFYTTSSCGVCGKASIEAIQTSGQIFQQTKNIQYPPSLLLQLPEILQKQQNVFKQTGGLHASALFNSEGEIILVREDVGRHNALDKVIGAALIRKDFPLTEYILLLSGRASFELIQKAKMANIKTIAAVGAPSSLAVALAKENGMTLLGFLKNDRFNIYCGKERILTEEDSLLKDDK